MSPRAFILLLALFCLAHAQTFNLVLHDIQYENTGPRCLDGSPAAIYIDQGVQTDKFVLFFQEGGLCRGDGLQNTLDYCLQRSTTILGSSKEYPKKMSFDQYVFMNPDPIINPLFHNWTRIFAPYCDGSLHLGFKSNPVEFKGKKLYFRGQNNTRAHFDYLQKKYNFLGGKQIVISGTSAGAVATYQWGNFVYNKAINKKSVYLLPDSGIFLSDFVNPWTNKTMEYYTSSLFDIVFTQTQLPYSQCHYNDIHECFKVGNLHDILLAKTLVIQSTYDAWGLEQILGLRCLSYPVPSSIEKCNDTQRAYVQKYHEGLMAAVGNFTKEERHGIWSIGCVQHGFVDLQKSYQNSTYLSPYPQGQTLYEAVARFMAGERVIQIDLSTWPGNKGCSGLGQFSHLRTVNWDQ